MFCGKCFYHVAFILSSILLLISIISVKLFLVQALCSNEFHLNTKVIPPSPYVNISDV